MGSTESRWGRAPGTCPCQAPGGRDCVYEPLLGRLGQPILHRASLPLLGWWTARVVHAQPELHGSVTLETYHTLPRRVDPANQFILSKYASQKFIFFCRRGNPLRTFPHTPRL